MVTMSCDIQWQHMNMHFKEFIFNTLIEGAVNYYCMRAEERLTLLPSLTGNPNSLVSQL